MPTSSRWMGRYGKGEPLCAALMTQRRQGGTVLRISRCLSGKELVMSIWTIVLIILIIALLGGFAGIGGSPFYGTGYYGGGGLGLVIIILLVLLLMGRL
jgi:hypothetical protein